MNVAPSSPLVYLAFAALVAFALAAHFSLPRLLSARLARIGESLVGGAAFFFLWNVSEPPEELWKDFKKAYWWGGRYVVEDPWRLYHGNGHFTNVPIVAYLFTPFTALPEVPAALVLAALALPVLVAALALLGRLGDLSDRERTAAAGLFLLDGPLYYSLREGNLTHFVLLLLVAALACRAADRDRTAGALFAASAILKPPLALLAAYYLVRREWKVFGSAALVAAATLAASVAIFGVELHERWFDECVRPFLGRPVVAFNGQSIDAGLARLVVRDHLRDWRPVTVGLGVRAAGAAAVLAVWAAVVAAMARSGRARTPALERVEVSIVLVVALVTSPLSWSHYYLLCLIPACLALGRGFPGPLDRSSRALLFAGTFLLSLPVAYVKAYTLVGRLLVSYTLIGGLLVLAALLRIRRGDQRPRST